MRFAGDLIKQGNPNDTISPQSADEVYRFQDMLRNKPVAPSFNAEDLEMTPEMTPGRTFSSPYEQEHLRDKYIRHNPGSGVAFNPIGMMKFQMLKQAVEGQPLNPGTIMSPKTEQEIYQPELTAPQKIRSPQDDNFMEMMKSGFV